MSSGRRGGGRAPAIADRRLVARWYAEGKTYGEIQDLHEERFGTRPSSGSINNARKAEGVEARFVHDVDLMPWELREEHRRDWDARGLRTEARLRSGKAVSKQNFVQWKSWKKRLEEEGAVVHYDPEDGFSHVPPREGVDTDLVRVPPRRTSRGASE